MTRRNADTSRPSESRLEEARKLLLQVTKQGRSTLYEHEVYALLAALGGFVPPRTRLIRKGEMVSDELLAEFAGETVVLKIVSPQIAHKWDYGLVRFVPRAAEHVRPQVEDMLRTAEAIASQVVGVLVCQHVERTQQELGAELFIGVRASREFGPVMAAGLGGIDTELLAERLRPNIAIARALALETSAEDFLELFRRTLAYELLSGAARGHRRVIDDESLVQCFAAFLRLARQFSAECASGLPAIEEVEVNPFAIHDRALVPLDGLCRLGDAQRVPAPRPIDKIQYLLQPRSMAVIGVSAKQKNMGRIILDNVKQCGFDAGRLYVIKEGVETIGGVRCVPRVKDLPQKVDALVVAVAASVAADVIEQVIAEDKAESVIVIPGGFAETAGGKQREAALRHRISARHAEGDGGPVFVGGNCLGIQSRRGKYDTIFVPPHKLPKRWDKPARRVALVSQSGAYMITRMSNLHSLDPQFAISLGNQMDLTVSDFVRHIDEHQPVDVFGVYVEGFRDLDGLSFARAVRHAVEQGKDVIFYKAGRTAAGRSATAGHTASIAGDYDVCAAAVANAGGLVAETFKEFENLLAAATALHGRPVGGCRVGAISNAGYEAVGMADAVIGPHHRVELPPLTNACAQQIREVLAENRIEGLVNVQNPLDLTPMATDAVYEACVRAMLEAENLDAVISALVPLSPVMRTTQRGMANPTSLAHRLPSVMRACAKPLAVVIDSGRLYDPLAHTLREQGLAVFRSADQAVRTLGRYLCHKLRWPKGAHRCGVTEGELETRSAK